MAPTPPLIILKLISMTDTKKNKEKQDVKEKDKGNLSDTYSNQPNTDTENTDTDFQKQLAAKDTQIAELTDTLKRVQADYENYRKRVERDTTELKKYAAKELVVKILAVLDSLDLAISHISFNRKDDEQAKGMILIRDQFYSILESRGVKHVPCIGEKFDPMQHEALLAVEQEGEENIVLEELQKGYMMHDQIIRPAKVKISKKS